METREGHDEPPLEAEPRAQAWVDAGRVEEVHAGAVRQPDDPRWVAPEDAVGLAKTVTDLMECSPDERRRMGERGRAYVLARYTRSAQNERLLSLLGALGAEAR